MVFLWSAWYGLGPSIADGTTEAVQLCREQNIAPTSVVTYRPSLGWACPRECLAR